MGALPDAVPQFEDVVQRYSHLCDAGLRREPDLMRVPNGSMPRPAHAANEIIAQMFADIDRLEPPTATTVSGIKLKMGTLRVALNGNDQRVWEIAEKAETRSAHTCVVCGGLGSRALMERPGHGPRCRDHATVPEDAKDDIILGADELLMEVFSLTLRQRINVHEADRQQNAEIMAWWEALTFRLGEHGAREWIWMPCDSLDGIVPRQLVLRYGWPGMLKLIEATAPKAGAQDAPRNCE